MGIILIIFIIFIPLLLILSIYSFNSQRKQLMSSIAKKLNLSLSNSLTVKGYIDNNEINIGIASNNNKNNVFIEIKKITGYSLKINIEKNDFTHFGLKYKDIKIGDDYFDKKIFIEGNQEREIISKFNSNIKNRIYNNIIYNYSSYTINRNKISFYIEEEKIENIETIINESIYLSNHLFSKQDTDKLLIDNINNENINNARIRNMEMLIESDELIKHHDFFKNLQNDYNITIAVMASYALKEPGLKKLIALLDRFSIDDLPETSNNFFIKLTDYLGNIKEKKAADWLIKHLNINDNDKKISVINALGKIGSIKAVEYLLPLTKGLNPSNVKKASLDAIQKIQANIPEDQKGDLTLTEIEKAGELSLENNKEKNKGDLSIDGD